MRPRPLPQSRGPVNDSQPLITHSLPPVGCWNWVHPNPGRIPWTTPRPDHPHDRPSLALPSLPWEGLLVSVSLPRPRVSVQHPPRDGLDCPRGLPPSLRHVQANTLARIPQYPSPRNPWRLDTSFRVLESRRGRSNRSPSGYWTTDSCGDGLPSADSLDSPSRSLAKGLCGPGLYPLLEEGAFLPTVSSGRRGECPRRRGPSTETGIYVIPYPYPKGSRV